MNFGQRGILKYLIFGSLFILVHFVNFSRFTLHCIQITFFNQFYYFLHFSPNIFKNCNSVQILHFIAKVSNSNFQSSPVQILFIFAFQSLKLFKFAKQSKFYIIADWSSRATRAVQSRWQVLIGSGAHMAAYKRPRVSEDHKKAQCHITNRVHTLSPFSYRSKSTKSQKTQEPS